MKKWVEKLIQQFDFEWSDGSPHNGKPPVLNEDRATLLFLLDTFNKHLIEVEGHPVRKVRETLDEFAKELINSKEREQIERTLFNLRQFISSYRIDETAYIQKSFDEFRKIIWDFVDQLAVDMGEERKDDLEVKAQLDELKEAVESNSIDALKSQSRKFIDHYMEKQTKRDKRRSSRMKSIRRNLTKVKQQLGEATEAANLDHLTGAYNRKAFDRACHETLQLAAGGEPHASLLLIDIDYFKRINDTYGHPVGDFVLKELVQTLRSMFTREMDFIARIGGEEFAILLPEWSAEDTLKKAEQLMAKIRGETYVMDSHQLRFTVSIGIAELLPGETAEAWLKRADLALYHSKNTGRNRATLAPTPLRAA